MRDRIVEEREYTNPKLVKEEVAEFAYRPDACRQHYRMVVVKKTIEVTKGQLEICAQTKYFFYITNERALPAQEIVFEANKRCNQENLIAQLKSGLRALNAPLDGLLSNGAYMLMTALAWNLKSWWAPMLPVPPGRWQAKHRAEKEQVLRMEFEGFLNCFIKIPCQIVRGGRRLIHRLLNWNPHADIFFRLIESLGCRR